MNIHSPLYAIVHLSPNPCTLTSPLPVKLKHLILLIRKINAVTSQLLNRNIRSPLIRNLDTTSDGVVSRENRIGQVRFNRADLINHVNDQRRHLTLTPKRRRQPRQLRLPLHDAVRLVPEVAHRVPLGVLDVHGGGAEVAPAEVGPFPPEVLDRRPAAPVGANLGDGVLRDGAAEVVGGEVARVWVDVEAVGRVCPVDGEGGAVDDDCYV